MISVVLVGDSIRMGYQDTVQQALSDLAHVWGPEENGGTSKNILANLQGWVFSRKPDLVHVNCGLHDLRKEFGRAESAVPIEDYMRNVEEILCLIRAHTEATVVWATTTPVNQRWHHDQKDFDRFEADVSLYNAASIRISNKLTIPVNDLFSVGEQAKQALELSPDGVHFTNDGYERLGRAVAEFIRRRLTQVMPQQQTGGKMEQR